MTSNRRPPRPPRRTAATAAARVAHPRVSPPPSASPPLALAPLALAPLALAPFALALCALAAGPPAARADVVVEKTPAVVEHRTFDPAAPPADLPPRSPGEAGATDWALPGEVRFGAEATQRVMPNDKCFVAYRVRRVTVTLSLRVVVWLPAGADDRARAHQDGHRRVAERAYADADARARQVAARFDGRRAGGDGPSLDAANTKATEQMTALRDQLAAAYAEAVSAPAARAQAIYDELTAGGANPAPDPTAAVDLAFRRLAAEAERGPAKPPATRPATLPARAPAPATRPATRPGAGRAARGTT